MVSHLEQINGIEVRDWQAGQPLGADFAPRLALDWNSSGTWLELFEALLQTPGADKLPGLVVGMWGDDGQSNSRRNRPGHRRGARTAARFARPVYRRPGKRGERNFVDSTIQLGAASGRVSQFGMVRRARRFGFGIGFALSR